MTGTLKMYSRTVQEVMTETPNRFGPRKQSKPQTRMTALAVFTQLISDSRLNQYNPRRPVTIKG